LKQALAEAAVTHLAPIRERIFELLAKPDQLKEILHAGAKHARQLAQETMAEARDAMGFKMPVA